MSRTFYLPKDFEAKSVYLNKTEMFLLHSALEKIDLEKTNEIYWNDIRNLCEKIKPVGKIENDNGPIWADALSSNIQTGTLTTQPTA
jgi:hypothetical protein